MGKICNTAMVLNNKSNLPTHLKGKCFGLCGGIVENTCEKCRYMDRPDVSELKCDFCGEGFNSKEKYHNYGSVYEGGKQDNYFVHDKCTEKAMQEYRANKRNANTQAGGV